MKNKGLIIGVVSLVVIIILSGVFLFTRVKSAAQPVEESDVTQPQELPSIDPKELGLEIIPSADKKYVQFTMTKLNGVKSITWEFSYDADVPQIPGEPADPGARVTQNFGSDNPVDVTGKDNFTSDKRELGTCSTGGKCRFDTGIKTINLEVTVTKTDGKKYLAKTSKDL